MRASRRSPRTRRRTGRRVPAPLRCHTALVPPRNRAVGTFMNAPFESPTGRAPKADIPRIARLFAAAFAADPVFDWLARTGTKRPAALYRFFTWILERRTLAYGETWITADGLAAATWIPPYAAQSSSRLAEDFRLLPVMLRLTGISRLSRGAAMA